MNEIAKVVLPVVGIATPLLLETQACFKQRFSRGK